MNILHTFEKLPDKRLRIFAYGSLALSCIDTLLGVIFLTSGQPILGSSLLGIGIGVFFMLLLLRAGMHDLPRILVPYISIIMLIPVSVYYSHSINMLYTIFIGAVYPFAFFSSREKWKILLTAPAPLVFFAAVEITKNTNIMSGLTRPDATIVQHEAAQYIVIVASYIAVTASYFFFASISDKYQERIEQAMQKLREANERDKRMNQELNTLVQIICHDIANPLQVAEFALAQKHKTLEDNRFRIENALNMMRQIVENVRMLQMARNGKITFETSDTYLTEVFENCVNILEDRVRAKGIQIVVEMDEWLRLNPIKAEPNLLSQSILLNLLTNAIKFSPTGASVNVKATRHDNGDVVISVKDKGIGIPPEIIGKLFESNHRTTRRGTDNEKGTGFGLPIAKTCITLMGGDLTVTSRTANEDPENHGTEFQVFLKAS